MTWKQPWAIGGGPAIPPEVMRMVTYSNPNKGEGILNVGDLRVAQTSTASNAIVVRTGGAAITNRSAGGAGQAYIARNDGDDVKSNITSVGSTARSDLVVARIIDPQYAPWETPANPLTATYIETFIVYNVPNTTTDVTQLNNGAGLGYSAIPLARIDRPAGATTVTQAQIKDLRKVANPRRQRALFVKPLTAADQEILVTSTSVGEQWPNFVKLNWFIDIPEWATRARMTATWSGIYVPANSNINAAVWARLGGDNDPAHIDTQGSGITIGSVPNDQRVMAVAGDDKAIPLALRNKTTSYSLRATYSGIPTAAQRIRLDGGSTLVGDIEFLEAATEDV